MPEGEGERSWHGRFRRRQSPQMGVASSHFFRLRRVLGVGVKLESEDIPSLAGYTSAPGPLHPLYPPQNPRRLRRARHHHLHHYLRRYRRSRRRRRRRVDRQYSGLPRPPHWLSNVSAVPNPRAAMPEVYLVNPRDPAVQLQPFSTPFR
jgi:hypothetical protein